MFFHSASSYVDGLSDPDEQRNLARLAHGNRATSFNYVSMPAEAFQE